MRQRAKISGRAVLAALALVFLANSPLVAGQPTASFGVIGTGVGSSLDGIYTSPYQGTVNSTAVNVICDDFADNSFIPEYWTAYVTTLSNLNTGSDTPGDLKWNNAVSGGSVDGHPAWDLGNQQTAYDVAAYLAIEITNHLPASSVSEDYSYALWELFDATDSSSSNLGTLTDNVVGWLTSPSPYTDPGTLSAATIDVENAISAVCGASNCTTTGGVTTLNSNVTVSVLTGYSVNIYSVDTGAPITCPDDPGGACTVTPPQEFITVAASSGMTYTTVPETSSLAEFAIYILLGGSGLLFWGRRRSVKSAN